MLSSQLVLAKGLLKTAQRRDRDRDLSLSLWAQSEAAFGCCYQAQQAVMNLIICLECDSEKTYPVICFVLGVFLFVYIYALQMLGGLKG